jgi:hypothetical protein
LGQTCCDSTCTDTSSDNRNCGVCGEICPQGRECCTFQIGDNTFTSCVSLDNNFHNCGSCAHTCPADFRCEGSLCKFF